MKTYKKPKVEKVPLRSEDVIVTSGGEEGQDDV